MAACFASILEIPIEEVPDYRAIDAAGGSWLNAINSWLSKHYAQLYQELEPEVCEVIMPTGWHVMNYGTREAGHSVVGFCGRAVWDPADPKFMAVPDIDSLPDPYNYGVLVELSDELIDTWQPTWAECLCPHCIRGDS